MSGLLLLLAVLLGVLVIPGTASGGVDSDGDLDLVFANFGERDRVCLGDGSGGFTCGDVSTDENFTSDGAVGDVDGDGHLDAVFANNGERNRV